MGAFMQQRNPMVLSMVEQQLVLPVREGQQVSVVADGESALWPQAAVELLGAEFKL